MRERMHKLEKLCFIDLSFSTMICSEGDTHKKKANNFFQSYFCRSFFNTCTHESIVNSRCIVMLNQKKMDLNCSLWLLKQ
jgi:hypothetical protein